MHKWNKQFASAIGTIANQKETFNRGASFLVAPHNVTYDRKTRHASELNHYKVVENLESILQKHKADEDKKMQGLSAEIASSMQKTKPAAVTRTEALLRQVN